MRLTAFNIITAVCLYIRLVRSDVSAVTVCSPLLNSEQLPIKAESGNDEPESQQSCCSSAFLVPALITFSDFIASLASGASVLLYLSMHNAACDNPGRFKSCLILKPSRCAMQA